MNPLVQFFINSTWFKKFSGIIGGFCLGLIVQHEYWRQIKGTLVLWGITSEAWMTMLWSIVGAAGITMSVGLSIAKQKLASDASDASVTPDVK